MTLLCGHAAHISGFQMPGDIVGARALSGGRYAFTAQALSHSTVFQFPFGCLREAQLRQSALASGLLQAISNQTDQAQCQIIGIDLPALARFGILIEDISIHLKKQNLSSTEFELPMPRTDISDFLALAPETICHLIQSFAEERS